ncbi:MAG: hypothetical protein HY674_03280 [Chloroflexi bacterium]|nr:hypothetical protein [Chloroflexota bacterium]
MAPFRSTPPTRRSGRVVSAPKCLRARDERCTTSPQGEQSGARPRIAEPPSARAPVSKLKSQIQSALRGFEWRYLWQQCQTEAEALIGALPGRIRSLEVSPDGRWLAAGSERGTLKVWNLATGEEIPLLPDQGWKSFGSFSPDSRLLLYTDQSTKAWGTIRIWDTQTRKRRTYITNSWAIGIASRRTPNASRRRTCGSILSRSTERFQVSSGVSAEPMNCTGLSLQVVWFDRRLAFKFLGFRSAGG